MLSAELAALKAFSTDAITIPTCKRKVTKAKNHSKTSKTFQNVQNLPKRPKTFKMSKMFKTTDQLQG